MDCNIVSELNSNLNPNTSYSLNEVAYNVFIKTGGNPIVVGYYNRIQYHYFNDIPSFNAVRDALNRSSKDKIAAVVKLGADKRPVEILKVFEVETAREHEFMLDNYKTKTKIH